MASNLLAGLVKAKRPAAILPLCRQFASAAEQALWKDKIGNREIVGFGWNGMPAYGDRVEFPFPAIRWREESPEIKRLREKEKADWRKLSKQEKKALYRASFCQTFSEIEAPTGEWKVCIAGALIAISLSLWFYIWFKAYICDPLPTSFSEESQKAQLKRMLILEVNPIDGLSSKWDYENKRWK